MTNISVRRRRLFFAATMIFWFSMYIYVPILGPYVQHLGGSLPMVGLVVGSYGVAQMVLRIPLGILSDKLGKRKPFVSIGIALALLSSLGIGLVDSPWLVLAFRSMAGAAAATWVTFTVLFSSYFKEQEAPKAMGVIMFYVTVSQMIATTLSGFVADSFGWSAPFVVGGVVGVIGFALSMGIVEQHSANRQALKVSELLQVGKDKSLLSVAFLAILFQCLTYSTIYGFTPTYAVQIGASKSELSILALVSMLPAAFGALYGGRWAAKYGERNLLTASFIVFSLAILAIPVADSMLKLYITQAIGGLGRGTIFPILMGLSIRAIRPMQRATAMGFFQSIYSLGMFAGPVLVGYVGGALSLTGSFVLIGLLGLLAALINYRLLDRLKVNNSPSISA